jgi:tetratricopeptide (TPR) repeat protein
LKADAARRQRRLDLQTSYGKALMWGRGFVAEETQAAFARVGELAGPTGDKIERFIAYDAQYLRQCMRGEFRLARETAAIFLREAQAEDRAIETGMARRAVGLVSLFQGDFKAAQSNLEQTLADCDPQQDTEARLLFGRDPEVGAAAFLAATEWQLGNIEKARQLIDRAVRHADELGHAASIVQAHVYQILLETHRDDVYAARAAADELLKLARKFGIAVYANQAQIFANWARGRMLEPEASARALKQIWEAYISQGYKLGAPLIRGLLADLEALAGNYDNAVELIGQGLADADQTEEHFTDSYLHRLRGDVLLKRDPADPAPAEDAYRTAIAIAKHQAARSYELLASLALAKLYQSTGRPVEGHAVLAPALEGFSPTAEMPEIAEAQALLGRLA